MNPSDPQGELLPVTPPEGEPSADAAAEEAEYLLDELHRTRALLQMTLVALLVLTAGIGLFLFKSKRMARDQANELRLRVAPIHTEFRQSKEPAVRRFVAALQQFAETNRNFQPVLERYRPYLSGYFTGPARPTPVPPILPPAGEITTGPK